MHSRTHSVPPKWAAPYLRFAAWTHDEFRNLLCGLPPVQPEDAPGRTRKQINDDFVRDESRRVEADRHIRDAIVAGHLAGFDLPTEALLEKITPHVTPNDLEVIRRAVAHERVCTKAYRFPTGAAIAWAVSRRAVFPDFPFALQDLAHVARVTANDSVHVLGPSGAADDPRSPSPAKRAPALTTFPNRARWLLRQLSDRKWTLPELKLHGGPDPRTAEKIVAGQSVKETVLMRLAHGLSEGGQVSRADIPND